MSDLYYDLNGIIVRRSTMQDVEYLKDKLRQSDIDEVWSSHRHTPEQSLRLSLEKSILALTIEDKGKPVSMFGINPESVLGNKAVIWFLSSDEIKNIKTRFVRNCRAFINIFLEYYPMLYNFCDKRNIDAMNWLEFCGARFGDTVKINDVDFSYFSFERKS